MAMRSQCMALLLAVLFVMAIALVGAEEAEVAPTIAEQAAATKAAAVEKAGVTKETATEEAVPTIKEKMEAATGGSKKHAAELGERVHSWREWAMKSAGEWSGKGKAAAEDTSESAKSYASKGAESFHASRARAQESAAGMYNKWSKWARDTAGKYRPKKNPAAEAAAYINQHTTGAKEKEEL